MNTSSSQPPWSWEHLQNIPTTSTQISCQKPKSLKSWILRSKHISSALQWPQCKIIQLECTVETNWTMKNIEHLALTSKRKYLLHIKLDALNTHHALHFSKREQTIFSHLCKMEKKATILQGATNSSSTNFQANMHWTVTNWNEHEFLGAVYRSTWHPGVLVMPLLFHVNQVSYKDLFHIPRGDIYQNFKTMNIEKRSPICVLLSCWRSLKDGACIVNWWLTFVRLNIE